MLAFIDPFEELFVVEEDDIEEIFDEKEFGACWTEFEPIWFWSVGGERPSLRSISSDFSGFCIIGGGFFLIGVTFGSFDCCILSVDSSSFFKLSLTTVSLGISSFGITFASVFDIGTALK